VGQEKSQIKTFEEASPVFADPLALIFDDEGHLENEDREIIIGHSLLERLLLVCFIERARALIRIISARKATKKERRDYEENAHN
jgi:uncharacterized DUF497 family protein